MKLKTFFDLVDARFQVRQTETEEILFDSYDDSYDKFEELENYKIISFDAMADTDIDNYYNVTVSPGIIVYVK